MPRLRLIAIPIALIGAAVAIRAILLVQPIGGDPGIYAYVATRILAGDLPYRDVFEQKPPGVLYTYALAFQLFGRSMFAVQAADAIAWAVTVVLAAALAWALWRDRAVAWLSAVLAAVFVNPTMQSSFKQVGQTETFIAVCAMAGLLLAKKGTGGFFAGAPEKSSRPLFHFLAGVCCGVAAVYKYNAAVYLAACVVALYDPVARPVRAGTARKVWPRVVALLAGFVSPLFLTVAYFWARGGLRACYEATVLYNIAYTAGSVSPGDLLARAAIVTWRFVTMNVLWAAGGAGCAAIAWRWSRGDRRGVPLLALLASAYAAIVANVHFYPQYFLQMLPPLAVAAAYGLTLAWRAGDARRRYVRIVLALAIVVFAARHDPFARLYANVAAAARFAAGRLDVESYYARFGAYGRGDFSLLADYRVARFLRDRTAPGDPVYIYGGEPLVLFLAERRSPSRFVWNDPFVAGAYRGRFTHDDLVRELEASPPAFFIVLRNDANLIDPVDSATHFDTAPRLQAYVAARFREVGWMEDFRVFERR